MATGEPAKVNRWLVQLRGDKFDLEEFAKSFPDGDVRVIEENNQYFLVGSTFESLNDAEKIRKEATAKIDVFSAAISLLWPSIKKPQVTHVIHETEGQRSVFALMTGSLSMRSKASAGISVAGTQQGQPQKTQAQQILAAAEGKQHLERALLLWASPHRSWPRLYCIVEEIEDHLGKT